MKEEIISFETAKLAKEKGFDWNVNSHYSYDGEHIYHHFKSDFRAPTQSLLQKWLRDQHKIHFEIYKSFSYWICWVKILKTGHSFTVSKNSDTYEQALEAGLLHALNLIP